MPSQARAADKPTLVRGLSLLDSVLLLVGGIIGSGIFLTAGQIASNAPVPWLFLLIWGAGAGITLLACFAFAELGAMFPESGGQYVFVREAYGDMAGFLYGWMIFTVSVGGTIAALAVGFAEYFDRFVHYGAHQAMFTVYGHAVTRAHLVSVQAIALLTVINVVGLKPGAWFQDAATWAKAAAIGVFVVLGLAVGRGSWTHYTEPANVNSTITLGSLGVALIAVFWAFDGWVYITWVAGEVKNPQRNLPLALVLGLTAVAGIYLAITIVYLYALPLQQIAQETTIAETAAVALFSPAAGRWLSLLVSFSCFGALSAVILAGSRVYFAMARDGLFFRRMAEVHPRFRTPAFSLIIQAFWGSVLAISGRYDQLFTYVMVMMVISYAATVVALFVLRKKQPDRPRPYRCTGYPWAPGVYVAIAAAFIANAIWERPWEAGAGVLIVLAGLPAYFWWKRQPQPR
jgi:APA family basic amino acid/polyamine antiporter